MFQKNSPTRKEWFFATGALLTIVSIVGFNLIEWRVAATISRKFVQDYVLGRNVTGIDLDENCNVSLSPNHTNPIIALASFPGSGNTWLRHLIELSTGIYTGSVYSSGILILAGFVGERENFTLGTTLTVKTHICRKDYTYFESAILILRDPYKALLAEFNRQQSGKTGIAPEFKFTSEEWYTFVELMAPKWVNHALCWMKFEKPLLVVDYLKLKKDPLGELTTILDFLNVPLTVTRRRCVLNDMEGSFHRQKEKIIPADAYTKDLRRDIEEYIATVNDRLGELELPQLLREYND